MYLFHDRKAEMEFRYPIDYTTLIKKGFQTINGLNNIQICLMNYSDDSFVVLIQETSANAYKRYETHKAIATKLEKNILDYEIFEYKLREKDSPFSWEGTKCTWKVIFHKLPTNS